MKEAVLVTGATGTVGSEVVKQLSAAGTNVRAAIHSTSKFDKIKGPSIGIVSLNYDKPETIKMAMDKVKGLFLLTPLSQNMVEVTKMLVEEAKKAGVNYIVKLSAMGTNETSPLTLG